MEKLENRLNILKKFRTLTAIGFAGSLGLSSLLGCDDYVMPTAPAPIAQEKPKLEISPKIFANYTLDSTLYTKLFSPTAVYCETYVENPSGRILSGKFGGTCENTGRFWVNWKLRAFVHPDSQKTENLETGNYIVRAVFPELNVTLSDTFVVK